MSKDGLSKDGRKMSPMFVTLRAGINVNKRTPHLRVPSETVLQNIIKATNLYLYYMAEKIVIG